MTADTFAVGDRVLIRGTGNPWSGYTGTIVDTFLGLTLDWVVELDGTGHRTAQAERNLEKITDGS